jgi:hypothetical protein
MNFFNTGYFATVIRAVNGISQGSPQLFHGLFETLKVGPPGFEPGTKGL